MGFLEEAKKMQEEAKANRLEDKKMGEQNGSPYIIDKLGRKQYSR